MTAIWRWISSRPRIVVAARVDRLDFTRMPASLVRERLVTWEAPVWRIELGAGYYLQRNLTARAAVQHNERDGGRVRARTFVSAQLAYWF